MVNIYDSFKKISKALNHFSRILKILSSAGKTHLIVIVIFAIIFGFIPSISILVMQEIVNTLQITNQGIEHLLILIGIYIAIDFLGGIAGLISGYVESTLQMKASITLNMSVLEKVKELSLKDFEDSETYDLIQRASGVGIGQLFSFFKSFILVFQSLITLVSFSLILISWRWWLLPVIFTMPLISTIVAAFFGKKQFLIQKERTGVERKRWYFQYLLTNDIAFKEIKVFNIGDYFRNKYKQFSLQFLKQDRKLLNQRTGAQSILLVFDQVITTILFVYVIMRTFLGEILLGYMFTYTRSISNIKSSSQGFLSQLNSIYQNVLHISLYFDFIDMKAEVENKIEAKNYDRLSKPLEMPFIEIKNLSFKYKSQDNNALSNINLKIEKGNLVAFVGLNGSGKTTLIKILSTLYDDYQGDIFFGKTNLRDIDAKDARKEIGILFQDFVRYELSVKENVALGQIEKLNDNSTILQALSKTGMRNKINDLDEQLGFWFDDGIQMSGGEWLRIALSRAFIRDASLYLLDEPNAALDVVSERKVFSSFKELCKGKIGIIVSHRISSIKDIVDNIVVFDNGAIQAIGRHEELLVNSEVYRELYNSEEGLVTV